MAPSIFVSYRRDDAAGDAGRLADHLYRRFGEARVFLDIDTIAPGTDFVQVLQTALRQTAVVLVVIGRQWVSLLERDGTRRLDDPSDYVRLEIEAALARGIPVVPVLVQGATMPRSAELPPSIAPLATRQAAVLDHAEFHADAERLCDRLEAFIGGDTLRWLPRRWWPAAALLAALALGLVVYRAFPRSEPERAVDAGSGPVSPTTDTTETRSRGTEATRVLGRSADRDDDSATAKARALDEARRAEPLIAEATALRRRNQFSDALATLTRARALAPASAAVREAQEDVAMEWIREAQVESGKATFGETVKPALAVVDTALPSATGTRRADLLAHTGWATFLLWRDGDASLNPADAYHEALSIDPGNPYANAMLAHWILFHYETRDVPRAVKLFETAVQARRARETVRTLQWAAYGNTGSKETYVERVRLADAMRREREKLSMEQASTMWSSYFSATTQETLRQSLIEALPPDDHIRTLAWALDEYAARDEDRRRRIRFYVALLHERAGRAGEAIDVLRALDRELTSGSGSLQRAVKTELQRMQQGGQPPQQARSTRRAYFIGAIRRSANSATLPLSVHRPTMPRSRPPSRRTSSVGVDTLPT